jgi:hypothetical protein
MNSVINKNRDWLNYQHEIGLRHVPVKKNKTGGRRTPMLVPFGYLLGFVPAVLPIRKFFVDFVHDHAELKRLEDAWTRGGTDPCHALVACLSRQDLR